MMDKKTSCLQLDERGLPFIPVFGGKARPWISQGADLVYTTTSKLLEAQKYHHTYASMGFTQFSIGQEVQICSDKDGKVGVARDCDGYREIWFREYEGRKPFMTFLPKTFMLRLIVEDKGPASLFIRAKDVYEARGRLREWMEQESIPVPDDDGVYRRTVRIPVEGIIFYAPPGAKEDDPMCLEEAVGPRNSNVYEQFADRFEMREPRGKAKDYPFHWVG